MSIAFEEARRIVAESVRALALRACETVPISQAHGRVLGVNLKADRDYPALRRSLRDGFAVRSAEVPGTLRIRGEVRAGEEQKAALARGEALEIMTGAPVPDEADAVVMVEHVKRTGSTVDVPDAAKAGQFINERGAEARAGSTLIPARTRLDAAHIASLAAAGIANVNVYRRPTVAILATGDEIVDIQSQPQQHQIRNSNTYMLAALVQACGGDPVLQPVARDVADQLRGSLQQGLQSDMLIVSGGVSAGRYDLVKPTLRELGCEFKFERVKIQPGAPTAFGVVNGKPVFGLPGNPGSTLVTFQLFAQLALALLSDENEPTLPLLEARFAAPFRHRLGLTRFLPAYLHANGEEITHIPWQGSSDVPALAKANVFLVADGERETWETGDRIRVMRKI